MFEVSIARTFRLTPGAIFCGADGVLVGATPLLERRDSEGPERRWRVRPVADLNGELSAAYRLPIDLRSKAAGLAAAARALDRGDVALAQIAAVLLQLPDPPKIEKDFSAEAAIALAAELNLSGLLKGDWDPDQHPRTGEPPNPGWFAPVQRAPTPPRSGWPPRIVNAKLRSWIAKIASGALRLAPEVDGLVAFFEELTPTELNSGEDRITQQWKANLDAPKTLEELQTPPAENLLGYEQHHIVETNPDNVTKTDGEPSPSIEKFGRDAIDDPNNLVWVPRLKHEKVTADYNSADPEDPLRRLKRRVVNEMSFEDQRAAGLATLRKYGVLK